jgi:hypothetical protein
MSLRTLIRCCAYLSLATSTVGCHRVRTRSTIEPNPGGAKPASTIDKTSDIQAAKRLQLMRSSGVASIGVDNVNPLPQKQIVIPSTVACDVQSPVDVISGSSDHSFPAGMTPFVGEPILILGSNRPIVTQIRIVALDASRVLAKMSLPLDGPTPLTSYTGKGFRFRLELCVNGTFSPITSTGPDSTIGQQLDKNKRWNDVLTSSYGSESYAPTASTTFVQVEFEWVEPEVVLHIEAQHSCSGIVYQVATNYARAWTDVKGHESDGPYTSKAIEVAMRYDGNLVPGDPTQGAGNPSSINPFPYGSSLSKTAINNSFVEGVSI